MSAPADPVTSRVPPPPAPPDDPARCPVARALGMLGGRWKLLVLWRLTAGPRRYGVLRRSLPGVSERMLIAALRDLAADGLVRRDAEPTVPPRVTYALTDRGRSLAPVLDALLAWSLRHLDPPADDPGAGDGAAGGDPGPR